MIKQKTCAVCDMLSEGYYVDIRYSGNVSCKIVRQNRVKLGVEHKGYRVLQSPYSYCIFVEKDEKTVALYCAHTPKVDEELKAYIDSYIELMEYLIAKSGLQSIELHPDCPLIRDYYEKRKQNE